MKKIEKHSTELRRRENSSLVWKNITYSVEYQKNKWKQPIKNVSGYVKPGMMLAIIGQTGSGKSIKDLILWENNSFGYSIK